ncbi:asparagine synthase (glutamine-hydrolyzing) [Polaribacter aquimarinus]|uniref:asparagine synthase (glutamine-hydrolyzing) n=1 Tax=Polaribacter aquimarinus TaxID=2100726 RepID=A0A2U2J7K1_9FLAO|nr:asparagine synthase (glutamine-hydrolyzing) [Polaribacter aquimarinus]PWG04282.1 asparagine synthase (glutamine-hydrolyzing) [Polaribacter aquimarinus]
MCGIAGIVGEKSNKKILTKMLASQNHRGPDNTGIYGDNEVMLGHNRLSIIDLTKNANQPFTDVNKRYYLTFNGEIYNYLELRSELNYCFKTDSDTEVLLAAYLKWGKDCLHKLNGMFSFAIWDSEKKKLFAARDRFGVKPFYYCLYEKDFYFSSEIKALFETGIIKKPNKKVWANYFSYGSYGLPHETFWKDIHQLSAGHYIEYEKNNLKISKWYFFEEEIRKYSTQNLSYQESKEKYTKLLKDSIKLRFRADVSIGFNISGGVDSSTLLALINNEKSTKNIKAFTFYCDNKEYDELPWVEEMISHTNNPLEKVLLKSNDVKKLSAKISDLQDEPYGGIPTVAYANIFKKARNLNTIVLLDGQGMDEQWAGYDYYLSNNNTNTIQGVVNSPFKKNVLTKEFLKYADKPTYPKPFSDDLLNKQYRDLFYTKIPRALRFNDRISMAFSTELREPFLDYRLVEFAFSQPLEYKIKNNVQKKMIRDIASEYLSNSISYAPKRPLQTPQREWLQNELFDFVLNKLKTLKDSEYSSWFNFSEIEKELKLYKECELDSSFHIWQWLNLSLLINK